VTLEEIVPRLLHLEESHEGHVRETGEALRFLAAMVGLALAYVIYRELFAQEPARLKAVELDCKGLGEDVRALYRVVDGTVDRVRAVELGTHPAPEGAASGGAPS